MEINRRAFFASAIAFVAALLTRKLTKPATVPMFEDPTLWPDPREYGQVTAYCWRENGHTFYEFRPKLEPAPNAPVFLDARGNVYQLWMKIPSRPISFSPHAFTLISEPLDPGKVDAITEAIQRFHVEDYARKVRDGRIRS